MTKKELLRRIYKFPLRDVLNGDIMLVDSQASTLRSLLNELLEKYPDMDTPMLQRIRINLNFYS